MTDVVLYHGWSLNAWQHGLLPGRDYTWEYPPGAFPVVVLPIEMRSVVGYTVVFAFQMLLLDAAIFWLVQKRAGSSGPREGVWLWLVAVPLLGPLSYARIDLLATALSVGAVHAAYRSPRRAGALIAMATLVKLWPLVVLMPLLCCVRAKARLLLGFVGALVVGLALAAAFGILPSLWTSASTQNGRGLQVESLAALPWMWRRMLGGHVVLVVRHLASEVDSHAAELTGLALFMVTTAVLLVMWTRSWREQVDDPRLPAALTAASIAVLVVGDKVLSPQYVLWALGLMALTLGDTGLHARSLFWLGCGCAALTQSVFPLQYYELLTRHLAPLLLLTARDITLVVMATLLVLRAGGMVRQGPRRAVS